MIFGSESGNSVEEKTIMLVGETGSGKSTLIDGMMNYILDVSLDDEFRYSLIDLTKEEKEKCGDKALFQTEWITCYKINHTEGAQIYYTLNIIDTPGFGDTRGIVRDKKIVEQMRELFSTMGNRGISTIDAVCFVTQAPLGRLSATQKYIFESILSLFGKNIKENIFIFITFADGNTPPVLSALKASCIPFVEKFVFNNSTLFASRKGDFAPIFWNMGKESFKRFFHFLNNTKRKSLVMTADVFNERSNLECTIQGLRPLISEGLNKLETLRQTRRALLQHITEIEANRDFEYEVEETRQRKVYLDAGQYTTNCLTCNITCHFPCDIPNNENKSGCAAMKDGNRKICPQKCKWDLHKSNEYRFQTYTFKTKKTYDELKKKYQTATRKVQSSIQIFESIKEDFTRLRKTVEQLVQKVRRSLNRLSEIALKPNPLSDCECIDLLIEIEKQEAKEGWFERVAMLNNLQKDAEQMKQVSDDKFKPWQFNFDELENDFTDLRKTNEERKATLQSIKKFFGYKS